MLRRDKRLYPPQNPRPADRRNRNGFAVVDGFDLGFPVEGVQQAALLLGQVQNNPPGAFV